MESNNNINNKFIYKGCDKSNSPMAEIKKFPSLNQVADCDKSNPTMVGTKKFPPPNQIMGVIKSSDVFGYCQYYWETNKLNKIIDLLECLRAIRKSIMGVGSDEAPCQINTKIVNELRNFPVILPDYLFKAQFLPTNSSYFDSNIWYFIYRAMLPIKLCDFSEKTFDVVFKIYENVVTCGTSKAYDKYKKEANVVFDKRIKRNELQGEYNEETQKIRVQTYHNSFGDYKSFKEDRYQQNIEIVNTLRKDSKDITKKYLWALVTLNVGILQIEDSVNDIIHMDMFNLYHLKQTKNVVCALEERFNNEFPSFQIEACTEEQWNKKIMIYKYSQAIKNIDTFISSSRSFDDVMLYDRSTITMILNLLTKSSYARWSPVVSRRYKIFNINSSDVESKITSSLNKISPINIDAIASDLRHYKPYDVAIQCLKYMNVYTKSIESVMQLINVLNIKDEIKNIAKISDINSPDLAVSLYYQSCLDFDDIEILYDKHKNAQFLIKLSEMKDNNINLFNTIKERFFALIKNILQSNTNKRIQFLLEDLLEN